MPSHPQIEEVEDSDIEVSDPSEDDIDDFDDVDIIRRVDSKKSRPDAAAASSSSLPQTSSSSLPFRPGPDGGPAIRTTTDASAYKAFQCLYPVYFDAALPAPRVAA